MDDTADHWLTRAQLAARRNQSVRWVDRRIADGTIVAMKVGRLTRIRASEESKLDAKMTPRQPAPQSAAA